MSVIILIYAKQYICITYTHSYAKHSSLRFYIFFPWPTLLSLMSLLTLFSLLHSLFSLIEISLSFIMLSLLFFFLSFVSYSFSWSSPALLFFHFSKLHPLPWGTDIEQFSYNNWLANPVVFPCFHRESGWNCYCTWSHKRVSPAMLVHQSPDTQYCDKEQHFGSK